MSFEWGKVFCVMQTDQKFNRHGFIHSLVFSIPDSRKNKSSSLKLKELADYIGKRSSYIYRMLILYNKVSTDRIQLKQVQDI